MENLDIALSSKKLEDLIVVPTAKATTKIEPTKAEIEQIIALLLEGKTYKEIRMTVRRVEMDGDKQLSSKGFSYGHIKEIELGIANKVKELTPCGKCGKAPCVCPKPVPVKMTEI